MRTQLQYFGFIDEPYGLECLERSASLGHTPAAYVLAVVLLCSQEQDHEVRGMNLLRAVRDSPGVGIMECRIDFVRFLYNTPPCDTKLTKLVARFKPPKWSTHHEPGRCLCRARNPFSRCDDVDAGACLLGSCEFEAMFFCSLLYLRRWRF